MVSLRCKMVVGSALQNLRVPYTVLELGEAEIQGDISVQKLHQLKAILLESGLELMDDKKAVLIEKIKNVIIEMVHYADELPKMNFSNYLSQKLNHNYTYLANLFSEVKGMTLEHYIIIHKIEKVKELIMYDELSLTDIAYKMHYSSVGHLSNQFKKITGLTPTFFKRLKDKRRNSLEDI